MIRGSGSQRTTTLAAPLGHDRAPSARPHAQPETMNPRPAPVVRLEGPLALGHGYFSSLHLVVADRCTRRRCNRTNATTVVKLWSRSITGAVPKNPVAAVSPTFGRLFEGTDVTSPGQTALSCPADGAEIYCRHSRHAKTPVN